MTSDKSGQAFPGFEHYTDGKKVITGKPYGGMTLRQWYAGMALSTQYNLDKKPVEITVELCFRIADAMLAEGAQDA